MEPWIHSGPARVALRGCPTKLQVFKVVCLFSFKAFVMERRVMSNDFEQKVLAKKDEEDSRYELDQLKFKDEFEFGGTRKHDF